MWTGIKWQWVTDWLLTAKTWFKFATVKAGQNLLTRKMFYGLYRLSVTVILRTVGNPVHHIRMHWCIVPESTSFCRGRDEIWPSYCNISSVCERQFHAACKCWLPNCRPDITEDETSATDCLHTRQGRQPNSCQSRQIRSTWPRSASGMPEESGPTSDVDGPRGHDLDTLQAWVL